MGLQDKTTTHKVLMTAGELTDVAVMRISLVDRGANRVPFRLEKRESTPGEGNGVIPSNWNIPFTNREKPVEIAGVAFGADVRLDLAKAQLAEAGLSSENLIEDESGNRVFAQGKNFDPATSQFLKFDEQTGVFLRNAQETLKKAADNFNDAVGAQQFIPGLLLSTDALHGVIVDILEKAENKVDAATQIKTAVANFGEFLGGLADKIPADVFKLEEILTAPGETKAEADASDADVTKADTAKAGEGDADASDDGTGKVAKGEDDSQDTQSTDDVAEGKVVKSDPEGSDENPVLKAVEKLTEQVGSMSDKIGELDGKVTKAADSAEEAKELAKKSEKALAAVGGLPEGDTDDVVTETVEKAEVHIPLIDTARSRPE